LYGFKRVDREELRMDGHMALEQSLRAVVGFWRIRGGKSQSNERGQREKREGGHDLGTVIGFNGDQRAETAWKGD
jgi:hypothetical protein